MNVIIMAAGVGSRLDKFLDNKPKCLIQAGGETLISRVVRLFKKIGIRDISVVTGYQAHQIQNELGLGVKFYHNPFYSVTNSIASLWLARKEIHQDTILMNADLFFEENLLEILMEAKEPVSMLADTTRVATADYRFGFDGDLICRYGKQLSNEETDAEYVGIARINKDFVSPFKQKLENLILQNNFHVWWEDAIYSHILEGYPVVYKDVAGIFWTEVDCVEDYLRLTNWTEKNSSTVSIEQISHNRHLKFKELARN